MARGTGSRPAIGDHVRSARGPPVEMPSTTMSTASRRRDADTPGVPLTVGRRGRGRRSFTLPMEVPADPRAGGPTPGRSASDEVHRAPRRGRSDRSPDSLATLTTTIGSGRLAIRSRTKPTLSRLGMMRSQVTTSGWSSATRSSASCSSRAVPTTSMHGISTAVRHDFPHVSRIIDDKDAEPGRSSHQLINVSRRQRHVRGPRA